MNTLFLLPQSWDLTVDAAGNIAMASDPYSLAQDAASSIKTFAGEVWYDTTQGLPYWSEILGSLPPLTLVKDAMISAALTVPEVVSVRVFLTGLTGRQLSGQVQITTAAGEVAGVGF